MKHCCTLLLALSYATYSRADIVPRPPSFKTVWSSNREYVAEADPKTRLTTVFRVTGPNHRSRIWAMYGWFRVASLTNDGQYLVVGQDTMNLVPRNVSMDKIMIYFLRRGEVIQIVTLRQLLLKRSGLKRTSSNYGWGNYVGLDSSGRYVVETREKRRLYFDPRTGTLLMTEDDPHIE